MHDKRHIKRPENIAMHKIVHVDHMLIHASPEQVRRFIISAERVMDYYPDATACGTFEAGKSIWCSNKTGVSLLEVVGTPTDNKITLRVVAANGLTPPFSIEQIKAKPFLTMYEDFLIETHRDGVQLTKTWRDIIKHQMKFLPMGLIIKLTAKGEHQRQVDGWNFNAKLEREAANV